MYVLSLYRSTYRTYVLIAGTIHIGRPHHRLTCHLAKGCVTLSIQSCRREFGDDYLRFPISFVVLRGLTVCTVPRYLVQA